MNLILSFDLGVCFFSIKYIEGFDVDPFMAQKNDCDMLVNNKPTKAT
jgi:hypothetical protein